jgi:hypothetical protein
MKAVSPVLPGYEVPEIVFAKDQPEYSPLPAVVFDQPQRPILTRWEFTDEERQRIANGESLYLWVYTFGQPLQPLAPQIATAKEIMGHGEDDVLGAEVIGG